ncbi:MAG TPA: fatty acid desaturase [Acidimicrobiales bacterium]|nr:fatty acid desaturase [Acidimicrobiales bacterium]
MVELTDHSKLVTSMTGGMVTGLSPFLGSDRLHPDGRPKGAFRNELRRISNPRNSVTVITALLLPCAVVWGAILVDHIAVWILAVPAMAICQNRLFILHHEAAHRTLLSSRTLNDFIGINLIGLLAFGTGSHGYRVGHMNHHRDEFGPNEPDFLLYSLYPITRNSLRRKLVRDSTGVSAFRILKPRFQRLRESRHRLLTLRFLLGQGVIFTIFALVEHPWLFLLLWVAPWAFIYQLLNRLRAIAEHGGMTRSADRRCTTHHVRQTLLSRMLIAPLGVGYHIAHHVDMTLPCRNLPQLHKALVEDQYLTDELIWPNYRTLWAALSKKPDNDLKI